MTATYDEFLASKAMRSPSEGFYVAEPSETLFPFQRKIVQWACAKGRAAIFAGCGLGKSIMQLEWSTRVVGQAGGKVLLLAPLAVAGQTVREAERFGYSAAYRKTPLEVGAEQIVVTNYDRLESFLPWRGDGVVLDESSILKSQDGATRTLIIEAFRDTRFKLACTATPAPNDFMELGNHAEFLGVMRREEMLATFFTHDGGDTAKWRLKGHAEKEFWKWVCGWAVMVNKPSDLGFPDGGFALPPLKLKQHTVAADHTTAAARGMLFNLEAQSLAERRDARRATIGQRVRIAADLVAAEPNESWIIWCALNAEGDALAKAIPGAVQVSGDDDNDTKIERAMAFIDGTAPILVSKIRIFGYGMNLQNCSRMIFVGLSDSYEDLFQAVRRCWRFGQTREVVCHIVISEIEGAVLKNIKRKEKDAERMGEEMVKFMSEIQDLSATKRMTTKYDAASVIQFPNWLIGGAS